MTTDPDTRARIEFDAAAYILYAQEPTMTKTQDDRSRTDHFAPFINEWGELDGTGNHDELCSLIIGGTCDCDLAHDAPDPCQDCGAPIPEEGDYCHDCAQEHVPAEVKAMRGGASTT
jgi:hypothetical protein